MNSARLALNELRRLAASKMTRLALVALMLVPTLYAGLYLWANKDPYAEFKHLPVAVVSQDTGTTLSNGKPMRVGPTVAQKLVDSHTFDWHNVGWDEADRGVQDGTYAFAVVMPPSFSDDLASSGRFEPRQAELKLITNDANNYMTHTIGNQVIQQVSRSVAGELSTTSTEEFLSGFVRIREQMGKAVQGAGQLKTGAQQALDGTKQAKQGSASLLSGQRQLAAGADKLSSGAGELKAGADKLASGAGELNSGSIQLRDGLRTLADRTSNLPSQTDELADGAEQVAAGNAQVAAKAGEVAKASSTLRSDLDARRTEAMGRLRAAGLNDSQLAAVNAELDRLGTPVRAADDKIQQTSGDLNKLSDGATKVAIGARTLANSTPALTSGIQQARTGSEKLATGAGELSRGATKLASGAGELKTGADQLAAGEHKAVTGTEKLDAGLGKLVTGQTKLRDGAATLHDQMAKGLKQIPNPTEAQRRSVAETLGNPIAIHNDSLSAAGTYGAGLAPFFMALSLWIGGYVLFLLVRPLSTRALAVSASGFRTALGGWAAPAAIGAGQVLGVIGVVSLLLRLPIAHPLGALLFLLLISATFVAILQFLAARFGAVGKFLGLVLMVVQLVSAGGTFPWQTLPGPLQALHHVLPMSYAIDGLRRLMYGGSLAQLPIDIVFLVGCLAGALLLSSYAARRARVWTPARIKPDLTL